MKVCVMLMLKGCLVSLCIVEILLWILLRVLDEVLMMLSVLV